MTVTGEGEARLGDWHVPLTRESRSGLSGNSVGVGVRPEDLQLVGQGAGFPVTVELVEELGSDAFLHGSVRAADGSDTLLVARVDPKAPPEKGEVVNLAAKPEQLHFFDADTGSRLADAPSGSGAHLIK